VITHSPRVGHPPERSGRDDPLPAGRAGGNLTYETRQKKMLRRGPVPPEGERRRTLEKGWERAPLEGVVGANLIGRGGGEPA
jgi:hypothetical protein